jgi:hypothetical protein
LGYKNNNDIFPREIIMFKQHNTSFGEGERREENLEVSTFGIGVLASLRDLW